MVHPVCDFYDRIDTIAIVEGDEQQQYFQLNLWDIRCENKSSRLMTSANLFPVVL